LKLRVHYEIPDDHGRDKEKDDSPVDGSAWVTARLIEEAYSHLKRLNPGKDYSTSVNGMLRRWGSIMAPCKIPQSHLSTTAYYDFARSISMQLHLDLLASLRKPVHGLFFKGESVYLPNPTSWKCDGYSRGHRSFFTIIIKCFHGSSVAPVHVLWRLPREQAQTKTADGKIIHRDASGTGVTHTFLHTLQTKTFPDARVATEVPLGVDDFCKTCVEICVDTEEV